MVACQVRTGGVAPDDLGLALIFLQLEQKQIWYENAAAVSNPQREGDRCVFMQFEK